jgi:mannose-1-phosphate guanylyltransferase/mannose-6-phosphate isomerase
VSQKRLQPVILSGGSGTRLWPLSRAQYPKQFLPLVGQQSLPQMTAGRFADSKRFLPPVVIANDAHRFILAEQLRLADIDWQHLVLEPFGRNTAPAAAVAAVLTARTDPATPILLLPSDHMIADIDGFLDLLPAAVDAASDGRIVTFSIKPDRPETGYGYVRAGKEILAGSPVRTVAAFTEKPDAATAETFLADADYGWNSGMFLFTAETMLAELQQHAPDILAQSRLAIENARQDLDFLRLDADAFDACPADSLDYAVMEKTGHAATLSADIGWSDVGAWAALWDLADRDIDGNAVTGDVVPVDTQNSYLRSDDGRLLVTLGIEGLTVVDTRDAILVAKSTETARIKDIVATLTAEGRPEASEHARVYRPWGWYQDIDAGPGFRVKRIMVKPGAALSLQRHTYRSEHWVVVTGVAKVTRGDKIVILRENESTFIPAMTRHRLENPGEEQLHLIEVQVGSYVGEDDIERLEDTYGRT